MGNVYVCDRKDWTISWTTLQNHIFSTLDRGFGSSQNLECCATKLVIFCIFTSENFIDKWILVLPKKRSGAMSSISLHGISLSNPYYFVLPNFCLNKNAIGHTDNITLTSTKWPPSLSFWWLKAYTFKNRQPLTLDNEICMRAFLMRARRIGLIFTKFGRHMNIVHWCVFSKILKK